MHNLKYCISNLEYLLNEWDYKKNGDMNPKNVARGTKKIAWWICDKGHSWDTSIENRTGKNMSHCHYCSGQKAIAGENDLQTTHPELSEGWHPTKNGDLTPRDVSYGSGRKVWWICEKGHEWDTRVSHRTDNHDCPYCYASKRTSFPELSIYFYINQIFKDSVTRYKYIDKYEIDIYIPSLNLGIEYDGYYWHKDKKDKDVNKKM